MKTLNFNDGKIRLCVNGDENRVISFSPEDIGFANRYYALLDYLSSKQSEYIEKAKIIDEQSKDVNRDVYKLLQEMCEDVKKQIDVVFGEGTSQKVFGDSLRFDMFEQFLIGVTPYFIEARENIIKKYTDTYDSGVME